VSEGFEFLGKGMRGLNFQEGEGRFMEGGVGVGRSKLGGRGSVKMDVDRSLNLKHVSTRHNYKDSALKNRTNKELQHSG
jgi:hypothetical protein